MSRFRRLDIHSTAALAAALLLHAAVIATGWCIGGTDPVTRSSQAVDRTDAQELFDIELKESEPQQFIGTRSGPNPEIGSGRGGESSATPSSARATSQGALAKLGDPGEPPDPSAAEPDEGSVRDTYPDDGEPKGSAPGARQGDASSEKNRSIDLGLGGGITRAHVLEGRDRAQRRQPSVGLLKEGLDALDAQRGLSRASPAVQATRTAALQHAPSRGMAIFELTTDSRGEVLTLDLLSHGSGTDRWRSVHAELRRLLKERRLRVPPGAKGLIARIRVDRGEHAGSPSKLGWLKRGAAVGQGAFRTPGQSESTRAQLGPGRLTPTLGGDVMAAQEIPTRVTLLFERVL